MNHYVILLDNKDYAIYQLNRLLCQYDQVYSIANALRLPRDIKIGSTFLRKTSLFVAYANCAQTLEEFITKAQTELFMQFL